MAAVMASIPASGPTQRPRLSLQTSSVGSVNLNLNHNHMARPRLSIPGPQREQPQQQPLQQHQHQQHQHSYSYPTYPCRPQQQQPQQPQQQQQQPQHSRLEPTSAASRCSTPVTAIKTRTHKLSLNTSLPSSGSLPSLASASSSQATPQPSHSTPTPVAANSKRVKLSLRTATPTVSVPSFNVPETPLTAHPASPDSPKQQQSQHTLQLPRPWGANVMATPPLSAESNDSRDGQNSSFSFAFAPGVGAPATSPRPGFSRSHSQKEALLTPYAHPKSLHSVLRNSPLAGPNEMPARMWVSRPAKQVSFREPLTEIITNSKFTVSNIDVLEEDDDASSVSSVDDYTRDGGSTPGPWEDVHRRMACLAPSTPTTASGGPRKRKRKEKTRRWVWTIGVEGEEEEDESKQAGAIAALRAAESAIDETPVATPTLVTPTIANMARQVDSDTESMRTDCSAESPTPTPSVSSAATTDDGDDNDDIEVTDVEENIAADMDACYSSSSNNMINKHDEDVPMKFEPDSCEMEVDTPRTSVPPLSAISAFFSFSFSWPRWL